MPVDHFKFSTRWNAPYSALDVCQSTNFSVADHLYQCRSQGLVSSNARPLGILRKQRNSISNNQQKVRSLSLESEDENIIVPDKDNFYFFNVFPEENVVFDHQVMNMKSKYDNSDHNVISKQNGQYGHTMRRGSDISISQGNFSFVRSKTQLFEHRYKIALARGASSAAILPTNSQHNVTTDSCSGILSADDENISNVNAATTKKSSGNRVVHLPLFKVNFKTSNERVQDQSKLLSARNYLKEIMENVKVKTEGGPTVVNSNDGARNMGNQPLNNKNHGQHETKMKKYQYVKTTPGLDQIATKHSDVKKMKDKTPIKIPFMHRGSPDSTEKYPHTGVDKNDVNLELNLKYLHDLPESDGDSDAKLKMLEGILNKNGGSPRTYRYNPPLETPKDLKSDVFNNLMTVPKYVEKPWRQNGYHTNTGQNKEKENGKIHPYHASKEHTKRAIIKKYVTISPPRVDRHTKYHKSKAPTNTSPLSTIRNTTDRSRTEPIIVPTHTINMCPFCNLFRYSGKESSPCPPNTPSLPPTPRATHRPGTKGEPRDYFRCESCHSAVDDIDTDENSDIDGNEEEKGEQKHSPDVEVQSKTSPAAQYNTSSKPTVLTLPKVSVKVLDTEEELIDIRLKGLYKK